MDYCINIDSVEMFGSFCLKFNDAFFPFDDWTDFIFSIIKDWVFVLKENLYKEYSTFKLYFMDGPYYLNCTKQNNNILIFGVRDEDYSIFLGEMEYSEFVNKTLDVGRTIVKKASIEKIENLEISELRKKLDCFYC